MNRAEAGVSDVVGTLLLVGITVAIMAALSVFILTLDGPGERTNTDLVLTAVPGTNGWDTGDEQVVVKHVGGEPVLTETASVTILVNGIATHIDAGSLDGAWSDGSLKVGEKWAHNLFLAEDDRVDVRVVIGGAENRILAQATVLGGLTAQDCSADVDPPSVDIWVQSPLNITDDTTGAITVTATLIDDCAGVNQNLDPSLEFRITPDAAWIDTGEMTRIAPDRWSGAIPDPGWAARAGDTLEYRLVNMTDKASNSGSSVVRTDVIDLGSAFTYISGGTPVIGTLEEFAAAQISGDGAWAYLNETVGSLEFYTDDIVGSGATDPHRAEGAPDDDWAILPDRNDRIDTNGFDTTGRTETISTVEIVVQAQRTGTPLLDDDELEISYRDGGSWNVAGAWTPSIGSDDEMVYDITSFHGTWDWNDVANLDLRAEYERVGSEDLLMEIRVDALWLRVEAGGVMNSIRVDFQLPTLPITSVGELQLQYRASGDAFRVEVFDGVTWNVRGSALGAASWSLWTYTMTLQEATLLGGPQFRVVDDNPGGGSQGSLELDFARVRNA